MKTESNEFWHIRSAKYDKLFWTKDDAYIDAILKAGKFSKKDIVLDVGTGTGIIAREVQPLVRHVIALDNSEAMIDKGKWAGFSFIKWDIAERLFKDELFDKVVARMVFHHIFDELHTAFVRCFDLLKKGGMLIVAEGIPPKEDPEITGWYTEMFKYKEERRTLTANEIVTFFGNAGFTNIKSHIHIMRNFSVNNWLQNSGLDESNIEKVKELHLTAPVKVKRAYHMRVTDGDILIDTKNIIVTGVKGK